MNTNPQRIIDRTLELVSIPSVVGTAAERHVPEAMKAMLSALPYFQAHPENLHLVETGDDLGRVSLLAFVRGQKDKNPRTAILIGHTDTVGISDYGDFQDLATKPQELAQRLRQEVLPPKAEADLRSGDYLFGRGVLDMKSGVAMVMEVLDLLSQDPASLSGNLCAAFVCDEEGNSSGMLSCVPALIALKEKENLQYVFALDTDYTSERTLEDPHRYLYAGTIGKLMPSFFIVGKETHVGDPFGGLDANELAAKLVLDINLNPELSDFADGELTVPPVTLRLQDLKPEYSVQTNRETHLYFNYATHDSTPEEVLTKLKTLTESSFSSVLSKLQNAYDQFTRRMNLPQKTLPWKARVLTYEEVFRQTQKKHPDLHAKLESYALELAKDSARDEREKSLALVRRLHTLWGDKEPVILLYFSPPYYPHIAVKGNTAEERRLLSALEEIVKKSEEPNLVLRKFYPYISDLSYFALPEDKAVEALKQNLPGFGVTYSLPLDDIKKLDLPVTNIGPYGYDAHKYTERIEVEYSFHKVPSMVLDTVLAMLKNEENE